jgi:hypothetical protein
MKANMDTTKKSGSQDRFLSREDAGLVKRTEDHGFVGESEDIMVGHQEVCSAKMETCRTERLI